MMTGHSVRVLLSVFLGLAGAGLIAVDLHGYSGDLYRPQDYVDASRPGDTELTFAQTLAAIDDVDGNSGSETERAIALMDVVQRRMAVYAGPALRVSPADNWLIWGLSFLWPGFDQYEFVDPRRALRRGLGVCGQQALTLVGFLAERGFTVGRLRLHGHMATWVRADGKELVLDPTYGTVLPFDIEYAEAHLGQVRRLYYETSAQGFSDPLSKAHSLDTIIPSYAVSNKRHKRSGPGLDDSAGGGALAIERGLYLLKWALPIILLAASGWLGRRALRPTAAKRDGHLPPAVR
jgi:hypothetical protein